jgi:hypothetical protein
VRTQLSYGARSDEFARELAFRLSADRWHRRHGRNTISEADINDGAVSGLGG